MKVLIGCEFSGRVRNAFAAKGHQVCSVDLMPSELPGNHIIADIRSIINSKWDLLIAFPPCTALANSGNRWYAGTDEQQYALRFVCELMNAPIGRIAIENPPGAINSWIEKPTQTIHPWQFGHGETKTTCLWLNNLPKLVPTDIVNGRVPRVHWEPPSRDRWKNRSRTYQGIADAMAEQWG
jgi:hypothetical protein